MGCCLDKGQDNRVVFGLGVAVREAVVQVVVVAVPVVGLVVVGLVVVGLVVVGLVVLMGRAGSWAAG